jgi:aminoglycoside phosphotransferase (APT) family kinase protein
MDADEAVAWALAQLGPSARVIERRTGEEADLWHLAGPGGEAWLKRHRHATKAHRERTILQRLAPTLHDAIPAVLAAREPDALLLSACPGRAVDLAHTDRAAVLAAAGAFLARLADVPPHDTDADPLPLHHAYARRIEAWIERGRATLPESQLHPLQRALDPRVFTGVERRLCHRDFRPENWIVADDPSRIRVIDFGQARPDDWLVDLAKLDPPDVPHVLVGFGRALEPAEDDRLQVLRALHELATHAWAASRPPSQPRPRTPGRSR